MFFQVLNKRVRVWGGVGLAKIVDAAFAPRAVILCNLTISDCENNIWVGEAREQRI